MQKIVSDVLSRGHYTCSQYLVYEISGEAESSSTAGRQGKGGGCRIRLYKREAATTTQDGHRWGKYNGLYRPERVHSRNMELYYQVREDRYPFLITPTDWRFSPSRTCWRAPPDDSEEG